MIRIHRGPVGWYGQGWVWTVEDEGLILGGTAYGDLVLVLEFVIRQAWYRLGSEGPNSVGL